MYRLACVVALLGCRASEPAATPISADVGAQAAYERDAPQQGSASGAAPQPLPADCLVELGALEEITRFLTRVASHGTRSDACVDGGGVRLRIDEINVCPAASTAGRRTFDASFRVTQFMDGHSGLLRVDPQTPPPSIWTGRATFTFVPRDHGFVLDTSVPIETFAEEVTPLGQLHDGQCYGKSQPFVPEVIELPK